MPHVTHGFWIWISIDGDPSGLGNASASDLFIMYAIST